MPSVEMTNTKLFGFLSIEVLTTLLVSIFFMGIGYQLLAGDVAANKAAVVSLKASQAAISNDVNTIKIELGKISVQGAAQADNNKDAKAQLQYIREMLERRL